MFGLFKKDDLSEMRGYLELRSEIAKLEHDRHLEQRKVQIMTSILYRYTPDIALVHQLAAAKSFKDLDMACWKLEEATWLGVPQKQEDVDRKLFNLMRNLEK